MTGSIRKGLLQFIFSGAYIDPENQLFSWLWLILFAAAMLGRNQVEKRTGIRLMYFMRALLISMLRTSGTVNFIYIAIAFLLGFVAYGMSIYFYILAQRSLGAARTSAFYAFAPFIGVGLSFLVFREAPTLSFIFALIVMLLGAYLAAFERHGHKHAHVSGEHEHRHSHDDGHHTHAHNPPVVGEHSHAHMHNTLVHSHAHSPDLHHSHTH